MKKGHLSFNFFFNRHTLPTTLWQTIVNILLIGVGMVGVSAARWFIIKFVNNTLYSSLGVDGCICFSFWFWKWGSDWKSLLKETWKIEIDKVAKKTEQLMKLGLVAGAAILPRYKPSSPNNRSLTATKNHPEEYATIGICNLCACPLLWLDFYLANLQPLLVACRPI